MSFVIDWMQPTAGDTGSDPLSIPVSRLRFLASALAGGGDGIIGAPSAVVTHRAAGANFSVDIAPFIAIVSGDDVAEQGAYVIANTAVVNWATPSPPGSGTRTHRLVAQVRDHRNNASWAAGTYDWTPAVVQDGGGGLPALPASALDLASISIAAGQANVQDSNISQRYPILKTLQTATPTLDLGPWYSYQAGAGSWNSTLTWVAYSAGNWPPIAFTVPASGKILVTVHAGPRPAGSYTASIGFGISGVDTLAPTFGRCVSSEQVVVRASARSIVTGLTPGASDVVTAYWHQNGPGCTDTVDGHIIVEAV